MTIPVSEKGQAMYRRAKACIPGGTQLLSKRPEMFAPEQWPAYYSRAKGAEVWDLDGNRYIDMSLNGVGACILGHSDDEVDDAVITAVRSGSMSTLNCPEEVELAELLCELHPWSQMVRLTRSGGEALAVAIRIARAASGREVIAFCGYHGWHDWYLAANLSQDTLRDHLLSGLSTSGVPGGLNGTVLPFRYNCLEDLKAITAAHGHELAAIVMEPLRSKRPEPGFLEGVRAEADRIGAALIVDEATMGFRLNTGGAHMVHELKPDMAVFAKALSNGYAMGAVIGTESLMQAAQRSFISSTYWTERIGPSAALATIRKHRREAVPAHLNAIGSAVQRGLIEISQQHGIGLEVSGVPALTILRFTHEKAQAMRTLFTQEMLSLGFLAGGAFYATFSHTTDQIASYLIAADMVFKRMAHLVESDCVEASLKGPIAHSGFQRLA